MFEILNYVYLKGSIQDTLGFHLVFLDFLLINELGKCQVKKIPSGSHVYF